MIMRMIAFTPYGYLQSKRHRANFFIAIFGVVWIVLNYVLGNEYIVEDKPNIAKDGEETVCVVLL